MGQLCCCSTPRHRKRVKYGYRTPLLFEPLLQEPDKLPSGDRILVLLLVGLQDVGSALLSGAPDAFLEFRVVPADMTAGDQLQRSEIKTDCHDPKWVPPARFEFLLSKTQNAKVVVSAYHYNVVGEPLQLGDAVLHLKDVTSHRTMRKSLKLHSDDGQRGVVHLDCSLLTPDERSREQEHVVFEFQRWQPGIGWGHGQGSFLATDPGRWGTLDGSCFDNNIEKVVPPLPPGWTVTTPWHTSATDADADGWEYAVGFFAPFWYSRADGYTLFVRRRPMSRTIRGP